MPRSAEAGGPSTGHGARGAVDATVLPSVGRSRPCDTCRIRKTRCVKQQGQLRCVLCTFHDQPCTFLRGPTRRKRRLNTDAHDDGPISPQEVQGSRNEPFSPPFAGNEASVSAGNSPASSRHTESASPNAVDGDANTKRQGTPEAPRPKILSNTLGLDLHTHAEFIGPTDYREPMLLDLHQPHLPGTEIPSSSPAKSFARRLDHKTTFLVHPDESTASETRRIADLDAIEAAVKPLGRTLVDLYFRIVHPSFPILHKDVFISKHRVSHRHFAPSLLAAVYLIALDWQIYDSSLAGREIESIPDTAALEELAERTISQDMRRPKLSTLEAGLLLLQRSRQSAEPKSQTHTTSGRMFTAQLVAMAQELGIHMDCSSWTIPPWEVGLRRRLAWALYMQDRWGACAHGRPFLIQDDDWDVQPCTATDYPELDLQDALSIDGPISTTATGWELFLRHIELARLLSDVVATFYSAKATRTGGMLDQLGIVATVELAKPLVFRLREWYSTLPPHLHLESTRFRELCANGALHLAYISVEIALYRALVRCIAADTPESLHNALRSTARTKVQDAITLLGSLRPEHTAAFWSSAASYQVAEVGALAGLLWATAGSPEEMAWCAARVEDLRWALRVRGAAAPFARESLRLLERDIGGLGLVKADSSGISGHLNLHFDE